MNTTETAPRLADGGHSRIKIISRIAMLIAIGFLLYDIWFLFRVWVLEGRPYLFDMSIASAAKASGDYPLFLQMGVLSLALPLILCIWYGKLAQLFYLLGRGQILTGKTVRCIKFLGVLCMINGLLLSTQHLLAKDQPFQVMGFFSFSFGWGIDFGPFLAGTIVVLFALIMDEGRKMQEERELTI